MISHYASFLFRQYTEFTPYNRKTTQYLSNKEKEYEKRQITLLQITFKKDNGLFVGVALYIHEALAYFLFHNLL